MARTIDQLIDAMMDQGWRPGRPASSIQIVEAERRFDVIFPHDFRTFFGMSNGGGGRAPHAYRGLMSLEEMTVFNERYRVQTVFPGLLGIANEGFLVYALDYRGIDVPVVSIGLSSSDWDDVLPDAVGFTEWLEAGLMNFRCSE